MLAYQAYQQQSEAPLTRIDLVLALYDRASANLARAEAALRDGRRTEARSLETQTLLIVTALASGIDGKDELSVSFLRLYEFVSHQLTLTTPERLNAARRVLEDLREGFQAARPGAIELERKGAIPPLGEPHTVQLMA